MIKIFAGVIGNSTAMIADGIHSASDIITSVGVLIGNKISSKPGDKEHNYAYYFLLYDFIFYLYISIKFVLKQIFENFIMLFYILYHSKSKIVIFTGDFFHLILN